LKSEVLPTVGAGRYIDHDGSIQFYRDAVDDVLVADAETDAGGGHISSGDYEDLANGLAATMPSETRPTDFYVSNPHIPEVWFRANVPAGQDHNDLAPSGYPWLEEYLNRVEGDESPVEPAPDAGPRDGGLADSGALDGGLDASPSDADVPPPAVDTGASDTAVPEDETELGGGCSAFGAPLASLGPCWLLLLARRRRARA
ncbi:MAG: hypothetical protein AAF411_28570, partial [Myxococcota bacterium]